MTTSFMHFLLCYTESVYSRHDSDDQDPIGTQIYEDDGTKDHRLHAFELESHLPDCSEDF